MHMMGLHADVCPCSLMHAKCKGCTYICVVAAREEQASWLTASTSPSYACSTSPFFTVQNIIQVLLLMSHSVLSRTPPCSSARGSELAHAHNSLAMCHVIFCCQ